MSEKYYIPADESAPVSQIGACLDALAATIEARRTHSAPQEHQERQAPAAHQGHPAHQAPAESYTHQLLTQPADGLLKKVMEEAGEVALAAKDVEALLDDDHDGQRAGDARLDAALDHLRYESADVIYHLFVLLGRYGISPDELAAELNARMQPDERPRGGALMKKEHIKRG